MPSLRPFRALRYDPAAGDPAALISPPYDVITPDQQARLLARHPRNSVRLDLPAEEPGDEPGARYRRAAAALAAWQADGTLRRDARPALYVYEQAYRLPGTLEPRTQRGVFVELRLEPYGPTGSIRPHERTLGGPKADRLALLRATHANLSPIVGLYRSPDGASAALLETLTVAAADVEACADDGVRHRLWIVPVEEGAVERPAAELFAAAAGGPLTIADGHHRYETALAYRDERPAADHVLALLFDVAATELTILPTHRLVRGEPSGEELLEAAERLFRVERLASAEDLLRRLEGPRDGQRLGLYTRGLGALLSPRHEALEPLLPAGAPDVLRWLDVSVLAAALEALLGVDGEATAGGHLAYEKDAREAVAAVDRAGAASAFLLDHTPVEAVLAVAEAGELLPQKSTYFYPKPATGLVFDVGEG